MSVYPGFGGQEFISNTLNKMNNLVSLTEDKNILIGVDGGINISTINKVYKTGIDVAIVGSGFYDTENLEKRHLELLNA